LLPRADLRPQPAISGSELLRTVGHHAFEVFPAMRQRGSGGVQRIADLIELGYPADQ